LLRPRATFQALAATYTAQGVDALLVAATFFVRYAAPPEVPHAAWYAQTIFDFNQDGALAEVSWDEPIPVGTTLQAPARLDDTGDEISYTTVAGDTLHRIAAALSLDQNFATGTGGDPGWAAFRDAVTGSGGVYSLPAATVTIQLGETLDLLAARMI